jgi:carnosine N-methyltransferase
MVLASEMVLNQSNKANEYLIQPFIHNSKKYYSSHDRFNIICIPDECPNQANPKRNISMVFGDFITLYKDINSYFNAVITCFFLDTAENVIDYIETIYNSLKKVEFGLTMGH